MLRRLREARGWTQEHLAQVAGLSVRTVQRTEAGGPSSAETLMALAAVFNLSVTDLEEGPHVVIDDKTDPWPGLRINVFKDRFQVPCVIELDSRTRTYRRLGFALLDIPEDELSDRLTLGDGVVHFDEAGEVVAMTPGAAVLVDGKPWVPREHIVEATYDSVVVMGYYKLLDKWRDDLPKHWATMSHFHEPKPLPEGVLYQDPDTRWRGDPPKYAG